MKFKAGDRVHVKRLNHNALDFYGTLVDVGEVIWELANCSNSRYENIEVYKDDEIGFGVKRCDYYTLATDEAKGLRWSDGSSAEGTPIMCDEEDTEEPEVQHVNDKFSFARSKNYDIQEYIQVGNNLNIAKNMKEGCTMPTIKTKKEMNLPELIEWGFRNNIENESYKTNDDEGHELYFDAYGTPRFSVFVNKHDTFTVETEEEITEDTVINGLMEIFNPYQDLRISSFYKEASINNKKDDESEAFYIMNDDLTMTLIWTKEKGMVE